MTPVEAVENATRLLRAAEVETNPMLMERLDEMASTWLNIAAFLSEHVEAHG